MIIYVLARLVAVLEKGNVDDVLVDAETYASQSHESAPHTSDNASDGGDDRAEQKKAAEAELAATIDRLYKLYPTKTLRDGIEVSTGKCSKDKVRLRNLLKKKSAEEIEAGITNYVAEKGGRYLKNFATFLNNFPEREDVETAVVDDMPMPSYQDV
ncbi:MAG: hypothetical protein IJ714_01440 [Bacteroidales bacterium]|nr:hypothetical protein [Bacteroidales bacterium]